MDRGIVLRNKMVKPKQSIFSPLPSMGAALLLCLFSFNLTATADEVEHYLPFKYKTSRVVHQGNNQKPTHFNKWNIYAFDFSPMPIGTPVVAVASGIVTYVKEDSSQSTGRVQDNNEIAIRHSDNSVGVYLHLNHNGALVEKGWKVLAGDVIGFSGNTGASVAPHLHVGLHKKMRKTGESIPMKFADVKGGVPKKGQTVTSNNYPLRRIIGYIAEVEDLYRFCIAVDCREALADELNSVKDPKIPKDIMKRISIEKGRPDLEGIYRKARDDLMALYITDCETALESLKGAIRLRSMDQAVRLAVLGKRDFASTKYSIDFECYLKRLEREEKFKEYKQLLDNDLEFRKLFTKAVKMDLTSRLTLYDRPEVRWWNVRKLYMEALPLCRSEEGAGLIKERMKACLSGDRSEWMKAQDHWRYFSLRKSLFK